MKKNLQFNNVSLRYSQAKSNTLENINLNIKAGKMVAIIGPSGAGKSTLFKAIVRSIQITKGEILLDDFNIQHFSKAQWNKRMNEIGFLNQKPNLINTDNVYNNIVRSVCQYQNWFYKLLGILTKEQKEQIFLKLNELGILDKAFYRISELSGGQQQRVEIAKLLIKKVALILADEPTSNLDFETAQDVLKILRDLNQKQNITILVNIHDLDLALKYFDEIIAIKNNTIAFHKQVGEVNKCELIEIIKK